MDVRRDQKWIQLKSTGCGEDKNVIRRDLVDNKIKIKRKYGIKMNKYFALNRTNLFYKLFNYIFCHRLSINEIFFFLPSNWTIHLMRDFGRILRGRFVFKQKGKPWNGFEEEIVTINWHFSLWRGQSWMLKSFCPFSLSNPFFFLSFSVHLMKFIKIN